MANKPTPTARLTTLRDKSAKLRAEIAELRRTSNEYLAAARDTANVANDKSAQVALIERELDALQYGAAVGGN